MAFRRGWSGGAWGSAVRALPSEARGFSVPDGLGGTRRNYLVRTQTRSPWGLGVWGGRGTNVIRTAAGLTFPNPDLATMEVVAWWAYATSIGLTRVHPDGIRVPVRGQPKPVTGTTRRNDSVNPGCAGADPLAGWNAPTGRPRPGLVTAADGENLPSGVAGAVRFVAGEDGTVATTLPVLATGIPRVESFAIRVSGSARALHPSTRLYPSDRLYPSTPTTATLSTAWYDAGGLYLRDTTIALDTTLITRSPALGWQRAVGQLEPPMGASTGVSTITIAGVADGATVDFAAHLSEVGQTVRAWFDGSALGGNWLGDVGSSPSTLAPTIRLVDGECPLDIPIRYELSNPDLPGVRVLTDPVTLPSRGATWMTDPLDPERPFRVLVNRDPERTYEVDLQAFAIPGRRRKVVRTESVRHDGEGELQLTTVSKAEHDALLARLSSPLPKLLRQPAHVRWEPNVWVRLGALKVTNPAHHGHFKRRTLTAPFHEVDRPVAAYSGR